MESNTRWQKVDRGTLESEKLSRPSLTYSCPCFGGFLTISRILNLPIFPRSLNFTTLGVERMCI